MAILDARSTRRRINGPSVQIGGSQRQPPTGAPLFDKLELPFSEIIKEESHYHDEIK